MNIKKNLKNFKKTVLAAFVMASFFTTTEPKINLEWMAAENPTATVANTQALPMGQNIAPASLSAAPSMQVNAAQQPAAQANIIAPAGIATQPVAQPLVRPIAPTAAVGTVGTPVAVQNQQPQNLLGGSQNVSAGANALFTSLASNQPQQQSLATAGAQV